MKRLSHSPFDLQEHLIKPGFFDYLHLFLVAYLNRFEKVAVPNEHLVPAARVNNSFYQNKNRTVRP